MSRAVGVDLSDRKSHYCVLNEEGVVIEEGSIQSTPASFKSHFGVLESSLIAIEVGVHSRGESRAQRMRSLGDCCKSYPAEAHSREQQKERSCKGVSFLLAAVCSALHRTRQGFAPPHKEHAPLTEPAQRTETIYASKKEKLVDPRPNGFGGLISPTMQGGFDSQDIAAHIQITLSLSSVLSRTSTYI